jgi:hypothetical protein
MIRGTEEMVPVIALRDLGGSVRLVHIARSEKYMIRGSSSFAITKIDRIPKVRIFMNLLAT